MTKNQKNLSYVLLTIIVIVAIIFMWDAAFGFTHHGTGLSHAIDEGIKSLGDK